MDLITIILIAIGLAMDCFVVSISQGLNVESGDKKREGEAIIMAILFGFFQGVMPLIGYFGGSLFVDFFDRYAPWIALVLLAFIGGKMIIESFEKKEQKHDANWTMPYLLMMAVATSIDALATGVVFIPYPEKVWISIAIIAFVSFALSIVGYFLARQLKKIMHIPAELVGGVILVAIGIKIFIEGVCF